MSDLPLPDPTPELEAEPLDIQHDTDPAEDHGRSRRIPNLAHAITYFSFAMLSLGLCVPLVFAAAHIPSGETDQHPGIIFAGQALAWAVTPAVAYWYFAKIWKRPFLDGIQWNARALRRNWYWIVPLAVAVSAAAQTADRYVNFHGDDVVGKLMQTTHGAWLVTGFGVILGPLMEQLAFRGFLLPALATAYDWLSLERTPAGLRRWETTTGHTFAALAFGSVFSSIPFALIHTQQVSHAWGALAVLFCVGLVLCFVRLRTRSLACSLLLHATYNLSIFAVLLYASGGYRHLEKLL